MDKLQAECKESRQAVALRFRDAVVVGALAPGSSYPQNPGGGDSLLATLRIGRGAVDAAIGVYVVQEREFATCKEGAKPRPIPNEGLSRSLTKQ